jgi:DNA-binding MurR/RpiR family transcriptional regulator
MIQNMPEQLPASGRKIAEYILENTQTVVNSTVSDFGVKKS